MQRIMRVGAVVLAAGGIATVAFAGKAPVRASPPPVVAAPIAAVAAVAVPPETPPWQNEVREFVAGELAELNNLVALQQAGRLQVSPDPPNYSR